MQTHKVAPCLALLALGLSASVCATMLSLLTVGAALAQGHAPPPANRASAPSGFQPTVTVARARSAGEAVLPLLINAASHPELLDHSYLAALLGQPLRAAYGHGGRLGVHWDAQDGGNTRFELSDGQTFAATVVGGNARAVTHRELVCTFKASGLTLSELRKRLGQPEKRYFDQQSHPVDVYRFSPHAALSFTEPVNSFDVERMTVTYVGDPLPLPSRTDLAIAHEYRLNKAKQLCAEGNLSQSAPLLEAHLRDHPQDSQAHMQLGRIYRRQCDLNGAIVEYREALHLARLHGDSELEGRCLTALSEFGVVVPPVSTNPGSTNKESSTGANEKLAGRKRLSL